METLILYPELAEYIYDYECRFVTKDEITAALQMQVPKDVSFELLKLRGTPNNLTLNDNVKNIIAGGFYSFKKFVALRIYSEHKDELKLNLCPRCFKVARTPLAKQCRFCYYDWH
ncbi:MAG TPA: hypothetical protein VG738_16640 [Chitinophagaceae bacterium]|nr:hypothetical protein [Chitinophagaceae bacterium]